MLIQIYKKSLRLYRRLHLLFFEKECIFHPKTKIHYENIYLKDNCTLEVGAGSIVEAKIVFDTDRASLTIGKDTFIGASSLICSKKITIGDDVLVSWGCTVTDHDSHSTQFSERQYDVANWFHGRKDWSMVKQESTHIKDKVWIGHNVIILKGVTLGEGCVVGAGSVVTKSVPPWAIVAGNPAKIIRELPEHAR